MPRELVVEACDAGILHTLVMISCSAFGRPLTGVWRVTACRQATAHSQREATARSLFRKLFLRFPMGGLRQFECLRGMLQSLL